jgi:hypothetical protein
LLFGDVVPMPTFCAEADTIKKHIRKVKACFIC